MFSFHRFYYHALRTPLLQLYFMTAIALAFVSVTWWYLLYRPYAQSINQLYAAIHDDSIRLTQVKKMERELADLTQSLPLLQMQIQRHMHAQKNSKYNALLLLMDTAKKNSIALNRCHLSSEEKKGWYTAQHMILSGTGSFEHIVSFFDALKKSNATIDCISCTLTNFDAAHYTMNATFVILSA